MIRPTLAALAVAALPALALAQQSDAPSLKQLELDGNRGYAVVLDTNGDEYHCEARVERDSVDLGPCKPLRLVAPLAPARVEPEAPRPPRGNAAERNVVALFERNGCTLSYSRLRDVLGGLGARQRQVVAEAIARMTERGDIADDDARERALLRVGGRCG